MVLNTLANKLGEADSTIMAIAGHVSRRMLERYSHVRMEAKRNAMETLAASTRTVGYDTSHDTNPKGSELSRGTRPGGIWMHLPVPSSEKIKKWSGFRERYLFWLVSARPVCILRMFRDVFVYRRANHVDLHKTRRPSQSTINLDYLRSA